ncbi:MAG: cupin domain-containing protein [Nitrosopumilus sp.]|nr:cupin domain-containing protein [Nitrosopumilus sp.]MDH3565486.1 cupin domain-containing protein [Nitrosopumilus sp.]MDH5416973.1 cupin domain-containing protein [Nitrosopumilus sp.]MDH5555376.1 cupin domain-containing protein [Nitrosopumilus sp.]
MFVQKESEIKSIQGNEGTQIKQYFHPHNTSNGINYSLAQFTLEPGKRSKLHEISSSEIYYILEGKGDLKIDGQTHHIEKNDSVYVPPNSKQVIENSGSIDLKFLCIVEPEWKPEDEIILE